jgi:hypothetical protein
MTLRLSSMRSLPLMLLPVCALALPMRAQQLIGYVSTRDADVTGAKDVVDGRAVLMGSVSVTAKDHTAPITLGRGGTVRVCQTSVLHLSESREMMVAAPLLFSLDRGAIEIQTTATATDAVMTPDLRFTVRGGGPLDLRLRVASNGDTCVENHGAVAPILAVSDPFGEATYELTAGQHVLFEHGSLHEVVDHESSPCGCPDDKGMPVADSLLASGTSAGLGAKAVPPASQPASQAAAQHPFPVAISEGLAPVAEVPQAPPGVVHAQVSDTLSYNAQPSAQASSGAAETPGGTRALSSVTPTSAPPVNDLAHLIGRLFHKLFRRG